MKLVFVSAALQNIVLKSRGIGLAIISGTKQGLVDIALKAYVELYQNEEGPYVDI